MVGLRCRLLLNMWRRVCRVKPRYAELNHALATISSKPRSVRLTSHLHLRAFYTKPPRPGRLPNNLPRPGRGGQPTARQVQGVVRRRTPSYPRPRGALLLSPRAAPGLMSAGLSRCISTVPLARQHPEG